MNYVTFKESCVIVHNQLTLKLFKKTKIHFTLFSRYRNKCYAPKPFLNGRNLLVTKKSLKQ